MSKTILFFGDSNTRGYGVGRSARYATLANAALSDSAWHFQVGHAESDFHAIPGRIANAVTRHRPQIIVWQCPTGPASFFVDYPARIVRLRAAYHQLLGRLEERYVSSEVEDGRSRYDAVYEGRFLNRVHLWKPWHLPGAMRVRRWLARRYGTIAKTTGDRYVELMCRVRDQVRAKSSAPILFLGLLPMDDDYYPGFAQRAHAWGAKLTKVLDAPAAGYHYLDVHPPLTRDGMRGLLLRDGTHLSVDGHRRLAALVIPRLRELMAACDTRRPG